MAVYKIFPEKDAAIYSLFPQMNTGIDEILDLSNLNLASNTSAQVSRALIKFNQGAINDIFSTYIKNSKWASNLKLFIATAQSINVDYEAYVYPVSGAWGMGTGKYLDNPPSTDGTSWKWRTYAGVGSGAIAWTGSGFTAGVTASYSGSNIGGGNWYTGSTHVLPVTASQLFSYHSNKDLNVDVKGIVSAWYSSSNNIGSGTNIINEGFIVKWEDSVEFNQTKAVQPVLQYYSVDTHTIYPPTLELKWNDFTFNTGSSTQTILTDPQAYISIENNEGFFYSSSIQQFRVDSRPQYPPIIFQTASIYTTNYYLPSGSSYWAIKDLDTNEYVINFDSTYTQISADVTSSFFTVYMNGLQPERYYTILIQTTIGGTTRVFDSNYNFKVING
jgi:hypothetical protein